MHLHNKKPLPRLGFEQPKVAMVGLVGKKRRLNFCLPPGSEQIVVVEPVVLYPEAVLLLLGLGLKK